MSLALMEVFNRFYMPAISVTVAQQLEAFNEASAGAIILTRDGFEGNFMETSFYNSLAAGMRDVDRYGANDVVVPVDLSQDKHVTVKAASGFGPIRWEPSQITWLLKAETEAVEVVSRQFSELIVQKMLNTAIACAVGAVGNNADATLDVSATDGVSQIGLNNSHALFGDMSGMLVAQVMDGATYHQLVGQNLANNASLFDYGSVRIVDILGKRTVVTDAPALRTAAENKILSLARGGIVVHDYGDMITNIDTSNGNQRIETTFQADYTNGFGLKGYSWDETTGGKSPLTAALGTGANWEVQPGSVKHTAGVILIGDASQA